MSIDKYISKLEGVRKTPHGYNSYCPYPEHEPKNSKSFHINIDKGITKCFSCGKYMDLFDFLIWFGAPFDVAANYIFSTDFTKREQIESDFVLGRKIPKSMLDRGLKIETLRHFELGYDELNRRITMPLKMNESIKGIWYRKYPKIISYSDGFIRDNFILNYQQTRERTYVEGITDLLHAWQNGTESVSAVLGTAITNNQKTLIKKHDIVNIAFDTDKAGLKAGYFLYEDIKHSCDVNAVLFNADLGEKNDPGNCSKYAWAKRKIVPYVEFYYDNIDIFNKIL